MYKTSVILPTYNEKENIKNIIKKILESKKDLNIIVIDDNSPDKTSEVVQNLQNEYPSIHLIIRPYKMGLGTAYITGFKYAKEKLNSKYVITMDSDFSHDPNTIPDIISNLDLYDVVIGSRYIKGGKVVDSPIIRRIISKTANFLTTFFVGIKIKDATSGFRGYRIDILKKINYDKIFSNGYSFLTEIIYKISKIKNTKIKEIPIVFLDRKYGKSKISKKRNTKSNIYCI